MAHAKGWERIDWHKMYVEENKLNAELLEACRAVYKARGGDKDAMVKALILCGAAIMKATPPAEAERGEGR